MYNILREVVRGMTESWDHITKILVIGEEMATNKGSLSFLREEGT